MKSKKNVIKAEEVENSVTKRLKEVEKMKNKKKFKLWQYPLLPFYYLGKLVVLIGKS